MIVYTNTITDRLRYITEFIGKEITGEAFLLTSDISEFNDHPGPKINYSQEQISGDAFHIQPHVLLFEKGIREQSIDCFEQNGTTIFFKSNDDSGFDIFAASFYLISRYEEYLPHQKDQYGRYAHENSLAFKQDFLNIPIINAWLKEFRNKLQARFPHSTFNIQHSTFQFLPTYDIDEAYSFLYKSWWRTAGGAIKDILKGNFSRYRLRRDVLKKKEQDPFDSYGWLDDLHESTHLKPRYFFLVAEKIGKYDRNILPKEVALRALIWQHADKYEIGVHPSWQSGDNPFLIKREKETIENAAEITISSSRQHFIRFTLPQTFRQLIDAGIREDFSMGYGSINGFRASVASPFYWYDLEKEIKTELKIYPFCFMEANSFYEQKYEPQQALAEMIHYYKIIKSVGGMMITIWHNTFLGTDKKFAGWREVYKKFIKEELKRS